MVDGVSGAYFERRRSALPNLDALARKGLWVERLAAEVPGTSLPGRTSMVTGVSASEHGIYGNLIWDGQRFRYANPDDVRVRTLPRATLDAGRTAAVVGFGMIRPEDATVFRGPWWANEMLQRARDEEPIPADEGWLRTARLQDPTGSWARLANEGHPQELPDAYAGDAVHYILAGAAGDRAMLRWSAGLATAESPPDLLITEILLTDSVQHLAGQEHPFSDWSIGYADDLVGTLIAELEWSGVLEEMTIIVTSDHGHGVVEKALYTERLLPGRPVNCEGSVLVSHVDGEPDARRVAERLQPFGAERLTSEYLPEDVRDSLALFCAPGGVAFQPRPTVEGVSADATHGPPKYRSNHGFRPGHPDDERFAIIVGPGIEAGSVSRASAEDLAATAATILGIGRFGNGESIV